ncbi:MAG: hypothetical protein M3Q08_16390 [Pseudomonadota bacterium]|nr:hypothetical protein [Pseudomonadota bacterium]
MRRLPFHQRTSLTRANGTTTSYSHDPVSRLSQLAQDLGGTTNDLTLGFGYNPASQIGSNSRSNDAYAFTAHTSGTIGETANGLNQLVDQAGKSISYDAKGNVTSDPTSGYAFAYSSENLMTKVVAPTFTGTISYDPLMRL